MISLEKRISRSNSQAGLGNNKGIIVKLCELASYHYSDNFK